jgi:hypothetical protein
MKMDPWCWYKLLERMRSTLQSAQKDRHLRRGLTGIVPCEREWMVYEREVMLKAVNEERVRLGLARISITDIQKAEYHALDHSDYTEKFALYCAELVQKD